MWDLVGNPEDRFSCDAAHMMLALIVSDTVLAFYHILRCWAKDWHSFPVSGINQVVSPNKRYPRGEVALL